MNYIYLGDRNTDPSLKKMPCKAVLRLDGKCIRGKNGSMMVEMNGRKTIVTGRLLRKEPGFKGFARLTGLVFRFPSELHVTINSCS